MVVLSLQLHSIYELNKFFIDFFLLLTCMCNSIMPHVISTVLKTKFSQQVKKISTRDNAYSQ